MLFSFNRSLIGALTLLALAGSAQAALVVNTGTPDGSGALAVDGSDWLAGEITLAAPSSINSINTYLDQGNVGDTFTLAVYADQGGTPGSQLFSEQTSYNGSGWNGISNLGWNVSGGNYWVAVEVRSDAFGNPLDSFAGVATTSVPSPLEATAFNSGSFAGYQVTAQPLAFGLQVDATSAVPEPEVDALLIGGVLLLGLARRGSRLGC